MTDDGLVPFLIGLTMGLVFSMIGFGAIWYHRGLP